MRKLDGGESTPMTIRLSISDRAALVGEMARLNESIETEQWFRLAKRVNASQVVRFALRSFWLDWQSCASSIRAYYAARVTAAASSWVTDRLLFAMLSNEKDGFASRVGRQSDKFSQDKSLRPLVYCGWMRNGGEYGVSVSWGVVSAPVAVAVTFEQVMHERFLGLSKSVQNPRALFLELAATYPVQLCVFGTCP